jgi:hypothetical protein
MSDILSQHARNAKLFVGFAPFLSESHPKYVYYFYFRQFNAKIQTIKV